MKPTSPASAHCTSSKTSTVGARSAMRSKRMRQAENSSPVSLADQPRVSRPTSARTAGSMRARSAASFTKSASMVSMRWAVSSGPSDSAMPARRRIISPMAQ